MVVSLSGVLDVTVDRVAFFSGRFGVGTGGRGERWQRAL